MERVELNKLIENCCDNIGKHYTSSDAWLEIVKLIDEYEEVKNLTIQRVSNSVCSCRPNTDLYCETTTKCNKCHKEVKIVRTN